MSSKIISYCLPVLLLACTIEAYNTSNDGETTQPRGRGRLVKLYSGARRDPIVCTNEGFKGDTNDCAVFYRCTKSGRGKYTSFAFRCPPGTIYDHDTEVCNHPQNTKRSECGGLKQPTSPYYEVNESNEVQEVPSPISTVVPIYTPLTTPKVSDEPTNSPFNQASTSNKWQSSTSTTIRSVSTTPKDQEIISHPRLSTTPNNFQVTSSKLPVSQQNTHEDICTSDGFIGDSVICHKFYRCVGNQRGGFTKYEFSCSEPTIWDDDIKSCNHPWAVKRSRCGRSNTNNGLNDWNTIPEATTSNVSPVVTTTVNSATSSIINESDRTIQKQLQISYGTNVHQSQTQISNNPLLQNQTLNYGDRLYNTEKAKDKQNQNQISHGSAISQSQTQISYGNEVVQTQVQIDHSKLSSQSQIQITESTTPSVSTNAQDQKVYENNININNSCLQSGFMADYKDCKKFYRCVDNGKGGFIRHDFSCGEGTLWDQIIENCNHAWAVKECGSISSRPVSQATTTKSSHLSSTQSYSTTFRTPFENNKDATTQLIPPDDLEDIGYHNNLITSSTADVTKPTTEAIHHIDTDCKSSGFVGDTKNCQIFYSCIENGKGGYTKYEFKCGEGTLWDADIGACNHAWAVKQCGEKIPSSTIKNVSIEPTTTSTKVTNSPFTTLTTSLLTMPNNDDYDTGYGVHHEQTSSTSTISTTPPQVNHLRNNCQTSGFMGDKNDCKKFYRCVDNGNGSYARYEFTCGEGTVWDSKIEGCNHAWAVDCKNNGIASNTAEVTTEKKPMPIHEESDSGYNMPESEKGTDLSTQKTTSTRTTTEYDKNYSNCNKSGFIGDETDCKIFYKCINDGRGGFIKYEFKCSEGTVWDQNTEACNHEWAVEQCSVRNETIHNINVTTSETMPITSSEHDLLSTEKSTSTTENAYDNNISNNCEKEGFIDDKRDCKKFYRCVDNGKGAFTKYEFTCGEGTYWNQIILACDHVSLENPCKTNENHTVTKEPQHDNDEPHVETTVNDTVVSTSQSLENSSEPTTEKPENIGQICNTEGFFPDQYDCQKFYRCVNDGKEGFTKYDFTCGDGTIWDQELTTCAHKSENNNCAPNFTENSSESNGSPHENENEYYTSSTTRNPHQTSTEKIHISQQTSTENILQESYVCISVGFYANPKDCRKFIRCVDDGKGSFIKYDFACGEGTVWMQELLACDHGDESLSCHTQGEWTTKAQIVIETTTSPNTASSTTVIQSQSTNKGDANPHTEVTKIPQIINSDCQSEGFYADKNDCKKYYRCVLNDNGGYIKYEFICGKNTTWDANLQICTHHGVVNNCQGYDQPDNQTESVIHDEISVTTESSTTKVSTTESNENENGANKDICNEEGFFGNTKYCNKFYRCVDDGKGSFTKYDFACGDGTIWDQDLLTCNHPHDVVKSSCNQGHGETTESTSTSSETISTSTQTTTQSYYSTTQSSSYSTTPISENTTSSENTSNCTQEGTSRKPANQNVTCEKAGYYPDPSDCKKFYRCVDWDGKGERFSVFFFECGEGTIWDPALDTCNHEESVYPPRDCSNTSQQNTTTTEQSTTQESTTTSEKTTTETTTETTTTITENTTTQLSSTSEPIPTQQSTVSEQTTTQLTTTNELTTTQQTTTSEQTTTQQSTSTEQTTTQQSTTSEKTSTQPSTTELSTTQSTSDATTQIDNTTNQQSTSTEQTTTQQSTTNGNTSEELTTAESTSLQSTTESEGTTESSNSSTTTDSTTGTENLITEAPNSTTTTESSETITENNNSSSCPDTDDAQYLFVCPTSFRRHPKYCNLFYQCTEDDDNHEVKVAIFHCPNNTIYDESKIQCVEENKADKKCDGEIATRHRDKRISANYKEPIIVTKDSHKCSTVGHMPFEKNSECSPAFLKCEKSQSGTLRGFVHRCPPNYMYWSISRRCEKEEVIRDCKRTINNWSGRWEIPIDRYNVAW